MRGETDGEVDRSTANFEVGECFFLFFLFLLRSSVYYTLEYIVHSYQNHFKHNQVRSSPHLHSLPELSMHYHVEQNKPSHIEVQIQHQNENKLSNDHEHSDFIPFVIETYGGIGGKAQEFLSELSVFAHDHLTTYSHFDVVSGLRYAMACSVQRGNALIALAGYANAVRISPDYA